jgi:membrane associated rhomboid family serine protease
VFNMLALVPIGSGLERLLGSVRYLHVLFLLTTSNALIQVAIAYIAAYNPIHWYPDLSMECSIGFSGVIFAMIVIETSLSTAQTRRYIILDTMHFFTYTSLFQSFQIKDLSCYRIRPWTKWEITVWLVQHFWILHSQREVVLTSFAHWS